MYSERVKVSISNSLLVKEKRFSCKNEQPSNKNPNPGKSLKIINYVLADSLTLVFEEPFSWPFECPFRCNAFGYLFGLRFKDS